MAIAAQKTERDDRQRPGDRHGPGRRSAARIPLDAPPPRPRLHRNCPSQKLPRTQRQPSPRSKAPPRDQASTAPIVDLRDGSVFAVEALARFSATKAPGARCVRRRSRHDADAPAPPSVPAPARDRDGQPASVQRAALSAPSSGEASSPKAAGRGRRTAAGSGCPRRARAPFRAEGRPGRARPGASGARARAGKRAASRRRATPPRPRTADPRPGAPPRSAPPRPA